MFTTLLAIINPLEALPVFLKLLEGKSEEEHLRVARRSCFYAMLLAFFFLFFGKFILWIFGVPLSMVRIVGGIILMRIGFDLFSPSSTNASIASAGGGSTQEEGDVSFVPLAMPIMCRVCRASRRGVPTHVNRARVLLWISSTLWLKALIPLRLQRKHHLQQHP